MMRTPWRFVADLVSRKPKPHSLDQSPAVAPKTIALEYKPVPEEAPPGIEPAAVDRAAESNAEASLLQPDIGATDAETEAQIAGEPPAVAASIEELAALPTSQQPEEEAPAPSRNEAAKTLVKRGPARRKRVEPIAEPVFSVDQTDDVAPAVSTGPKSFSNQMSDLDAEVDALRRQLAKKLSEQNAQLRKMLARFDPR